DVKAERAGVPAARRECEVAGSRVNLRVGVKRPGRAAEVECQLLPGFPGRAGRNVGGPSGDDLLVAVSLYLDSRPGSEIRRQVDEKFSRADVRHAAKRAVGFALVVKRRARAAAIMGKTAKERHVPG